MTSPSSSGQKPEKTECPADDLELRNEIQDRYRTRPVEWFDWLVARVTLPRSDLVLDLGGGPGTFWQYAGTRASSARVILLTDTSPEMLMYARCTLNDPDRVFRLAILDASRISLPDGACQVVIAGGLLDLVSDLEQALKEIRRVLKPGGLFYATAGGLQHLQEMEDLVEPFAPGAELGGKPDQFGSENGTGILKQYFSHIQRDVYRNKLSFERPAPVIDYVLSENSVRRSLTPGRLSGLIEAVQKRFTDQGSLQTTIEKALFVAINP